MIVYLYLTLHMHPGYLYLRPPPTLIENARRRHAEVWTVVDIPLYKELGAADNDPYWYRTNNGIQTRAQAVQIRDYYNKSELPPYETNEVEATIPASSLEPMGAQALGQQAPNLSIISTDEDMVDVSAPQEKAANVTVEEEEWKQDAITMTEEDYIMKYYSDKADATNSGITMDMYLGLRTGQVLSISLLLAMADAQLQKKWKGVRCRDFTVMTQPQEHGQCSATSLRNRTTTRNTEVMCIVHVSPMHYSMVIVLKQGLRAGLIWCDSLQRDGRQPLATYSQYYHFLEMEMNRPQAFQPTRHYTSELQIRTHCPVLPRQCNGTDCGIFTLLYQQTVSNRYGTTAGQEEEAIPEWVITESRAER
jgi:hypothetical protein